MVFAIELTWSGLEEPHADEDGEEKTGDDDDEDQGGEESVHGHGHRSRLGSLVHKGLTVASQTKPLQGPGAETLLTVQYFPLGLLLGLGVGGEILTELSGSQIPAKESL